jgi:hypothetical protein
MNNPDERAEVPVLTQIADEDAPRPPAVDAAALEALSRELERAVLERLRPEIDRVIAQALDGVRAELAVSVTQMVREAVAASVAHALALPQKG